MLASGAVAAALAWRLWRVPGLEGGLPLWDPAEHGFAGVALAERLRHGDLIGFLLGLNGQVLWPFVHSLLLAPWALAFGSDYATPARLSSLLFAATILALCMTGLRLHPARGPWVGVAAAALGLTAPIYHVFGTVCMLEMPGAFLLALTAWLHVRAATEPAPRRTMVAAGLTSAALFLCKYNYGLMWIAALALFEWLALPAARRIELLSRVRSFVTTGRWLRPFPLLVLAFLLVIAAIHFTGGGVITIDRMRISVRSPGNAIYALYLILLAGAFLGIRRAGGWGPVWRRLSERHRVLMATLVLPLAVWLLIPVPNRVRALAGFVVNRDSGQPFGSLDTLLFYPRAFAHDYSPAPLIGWLVLALALSPPRRGSTPRDPAWLLYLAMCVGLVATMLHPYRQPRFLFTTAPLVWLLAARQAVTFLAWGLRGPAWLREAAWAAALVALPAAGLLAAPRLEATRTGYRQLLAPAAIEPVLDRVLDQAQRIEARATLLGGWNGMSPALLRWHRLLRAPSFPEARLPRPAHWLEAGSPESTLVTRIEALRRDGSPVIAAISDAAFDGATGEYWQETWADRATVARLRIDPDVVIEREDVLPETGFRVTTFRFVTSGP